MPLAAGPSPLLHEIRPESAARRQPAHVTPGRPAMGDSDRRAVRRAVRPAGRRCPDSAVVPPSAGGDAKAVVRPPSARISFASGGPRVESKATRLGVALPRVRTIPKQDLQHSP
jgi:hypothetical protein